MAEDPRLDAARYRVDKAAREAGFAGDEDADPASAAPRADPAAPTAHERAMYVETAIQQAIRRGDFDDLPGYGKPLEGLGDHHDPNWWIRRKIQTEQLTGLGPPALRLRVEHAEFDERVDALTREPDVREYVTDFNRRVVEARRQLQGGRPVVTPTRDVDAEVDAWRARRAARTPPPAPDPPRRRRWSLRRNRQEDA
ncbi:DUF1992 domain-containing protein [Microbacterium sp. T2.11-28]|uniref:DnaJ family domain-containing protein n=1 Tax=Microbacterium sp. T2.11-28 TaxID=3041169 RepID=UPI0024779141|nr:DUF1992 domain-containing protein [Microbacterium sp. T2.11-28]CAI9388461.1 hypothetical protein MICABA_03064 [Microbacterium sp. T2.11-28]